MTPFRFGDLGRVQFERFCVELVALEHGVTGSEWIERPRAASVLLPGGTLAIVAWLRDDPESQLQDVVDETLAEWSAREPASVLVLTNAPARVEDAAVLGPDELARRFAASAELRSRAPSVLGICDVHELVDPDVAARSSADLEAAAALARVFVPTRAYAHTLAVLERHGFAVLTGPPEMGKTAIARMIGLASLTAGWELHECTRPEELWAVYARDRRQVFVADDAFGSTEYRPEAAERWSVELDRVLRAMDERHRLLWTSRPAPLKAALRRIHREHGVERFPRPAEVHVDAAALDVREKALILFRHARQARLNEERRDLVRAHGWEIVSHEHFTPERIRRFATRVNSLAWTGDLAALVAEEIREPTEAMAASFHALAPEHRAVLVALLDAPAEPVPERELASAVRRHAAAGFARSPADVVDRLADHFLRVEAAGIRWVHPSWRDLVIEELAADGEARRAFLHACGIDGVALALSTGGGRAGERELPLLRSDADWDALADRLATLVPELDAPAVTRLLAVLREATPGPEAAALAAYVLALLARVWERGHEVVPVALLREWFELADELPEPPPAPSAAFTWFELAPTSRVDPSSLQEVVRLDEWVALVELLQERAPDALRAFGFPDAHAPRISLLVEDAAVLPPPDHADLLARVLLGLYRVAPRYAPRAHAAAARLRGLRHPYSPEPVPQFRELSPELAALLDAPLVTAHAEEQLVARVLRDL